MIYGGPELVAAFGKWRASAHDPKKSMRLMDGALRAMRSDIGESNKGIAEYELTSLSIIGGRAKKRESVAVAAGRACPSRVRRPGQARSSTP